MDDELKNKEHEQNTREKQSVSNPKRYARQSTK